VASVREATYQLLRSLQLTTIFGNPGSTEETFLQDFPDDFTYVLGLQESSVVAMADGYAQMMERPALVNLHTAPGVGNSLGNLSTAWHNKTPLIITAGQQTREMLLMEPFLTNLEATELPKPYVKWSYETARAEDAPAAIMRAYSEALQPPSRPVFVSIPVDDWDKDALGVAVVRQVSRRMAPDPERIAEVADALSKSKNPLLVTGADIDRTNSWDLAISLAELLRCPVWAAPASERVGFPENHPQYQGVLPFAVKPLGEKLKDHDLVLVIGAPVFRYYPNIPGDILPAGTRLIQVTDDPHYTAAAPVGESILGDVGLALQALTKLVTPSKRATPSAVPAPPAPEAKTPISPAFLFNAIAETRSEDSVIVEESLSNLATLHKYIRVTKPKSFLTMASGGLGFGLPAAIGVALAERETGRNRKVIAIIGDGSFQYSIQALWTAVQHNLPVLFIVPRNSEYATLKSFANQEKTRGVPGLDLPGLQTAVLAQGYGCEAVRVTKPEELKAALEKNMANLVPTVLEVLITADVPPLLK